VGRANTCFFVALLVSMITNLQLLLPMSSFAVRLRLVGIFLCDVIISKRRHLSFEQFRRSFFMITDMKAYLR
jgi:hypothetical protein